MNFPSSAMSCEPAGLQRSERIVIGRGGIRLCAHMKRSRRPAAGTQPQPSALYCLCVFGVGGCDRDRVFRRLPIRPERERTHLLTCTRSMREKPGRVRVRLLSANAIRYSPIVTHGLCQCHARLGGAAGQCVHPETQRASRRGSHSELAAQRISVHAASFAEKSRAKRTS